MKSIHIYIYIYILRENYGQNSELKMENMSAETQNIEKIEIRLGEIGKIFQQIGEMAEMQRIMIERYLGY